MVQISVDAYLNYFELTRESFIEPHLEIQEIFDSYDNVEKKEEYIKVLKNKHDAFHEYLLITYENNDDLQLLTKLHSFQQEYPEFQLSKLKSYNIEVEIDRSEINSLNDWCPLISKYKKIDSALKIIDASPHYHDYFINKKKAKNFLTEDERSFIKSWSIALTNYVKNMGIENIIDDNLILNAAKVNPFFKNCPEGVILNEINSARESLLISKKPLTDIGFSIGGKYLRYYAGYIYYDDYLNLDQGTLIMHTKSFGDMEFSYSIEGDQLVIIMDGYKFRYEIFSKNKLEKEEGLEKFTYLKNIPVSVNGIYYLVNNKTKKINLNEYIKIQNNKVSLYENNENLMNLKVVQFDELLCSEIDGNIKSAFKIINNDEIEFILTNSIFRKNK